MLAASPGGSNVPPDHLQPTPVTAFSAPAAQRLGKYRAGLGPQSQPAPTPQQDPAIQDRSVAPPTVGAENHGLPFAGYPQAEAVFPGAVQTHELLARAAQPRGSQHGQQQR